MRATLTVILMAVMALSVAGCRKVAVLHTDRGDKVTRVVFLPDGKTLVGAVAHASDYTTSFKVWNAITGKELRTLVEEELACPYSFAVSPDGQTLASAVQEAPLASKAKIRLWDIGTATEVRTLGEDASGIAYLAFSLDGQTVASASYDNRTVRLWSVVSGALRHVISGATAPMTFSPAGRSLATAAGKGEVKIWNAATGTLLRTLVWSPADESLPIAFRSRRNVVSLAWSSDGCVLASSADDFTIRFWDAATGREIRTIRTAFSHPVAATFPAGNAMFAFWDGGLMKLIDAQTGEEWRVRRGDDYPQIAFSPDGTRLAVVGDKCTCEELRLRGSQAFRE